MDQAVNDRVSEEMAKMSAAKKPDDYDPDLDEELDREEELILKSMRAAKLAEIEAKKQKKDQSRAQQRFGEYREIVEGEFLDSVTKNKLAVVHFYHNDFERCKIIDLHLQKIAIGHPETVFVRLNCEKSPFFVQKLQIKVLPTICLFENGICKDKIVGFEDLGGKDEFPTLLLLRRIAKAKVVKLKSDEKPKFDLGGKRIQHSSDEESDDDY